MDRRPPHDEDLERHILGAAFVSDEAAALLCAARPEDFYIPRHALVARAIQTVCGAGDPCDIVLVLSELRRMGRLQTAGGEACIASLADVVATAAHARQHLRELSDLAQQRRLLAALHTALDEGYSGKHTARVFSDLALKEVLTATHAPEASEPQRLSDVVANVWAELEQGPKAHRGYRTGLHALDEILLPIEPKQLVLIAARPSAGKTSLVLHLTTHIAKQGRSALFFSLETTKEKLARRALSQTAAVPMNNLTTGQLGPSDWEELVAAAQALQGLPVWIDDGYDLTGPRMRAKCRRLVAKHGPLGVIVIDYLQLLEAAQRGESREREIAEVSRGLKRLAKEFDCPVLALSQLNRDSEKREDKAPSIADLRGSGQLEQDADAVLLMQRTGDTETTIWVAKQKDGPTGEAKVRFDGATMRFGDTDNVYPLRKASNT